MSLPERDRFGRQWLAAGLLLALAAGAGVGLSSLARPKTASPAARAGAVDWFLVMRMPAITAQYESSVDVMKARYERWLTALQRAGYQPLRLSQALALLESGQGLPERSVVAVFEPGYRRTQEIVDPIFRRRGWPAVWLTDSKAMRAGHRDFVTYRAARLLAGSGWWDVGYRRGDGSYDVRARERRFSLGGRKRRPWSEVEGTFALNRGAKRAGLEVLTVNPDWTPEELVSRLNAELPFERRTCLSKAVIQSREWGVSGAPAAPGRRCESFDLQPTSAKRDTRLHWLGTAGVRDLRIEVEAASVVGELRVHLLRDEALDRRLSVTFAERTVSVDLRLGSDVRRLVSLPHGSRRRPFKAAIGLRDGRLSLKMNQGQTWVSPKLDLWASGLLVVQVSENMRGAARAEGVRLAFEPLRSTPLAASRP